LANLPCGVGEIKTAVKARETITEISGIFNILRDLDSAWEYLLVAQPKLAADDPWQAELSEAKQFVVTTLADPAKRNSANISGQLRGRLENVQAAYIQRYLALHKQYRLDRAGDETKHTLTRDPRWAKMRALSKLSLLPAQQLRALEDRLGAIASCPNLQAIDLKNHAHCEHCGFTPAAIQEEQKSATAQLEKVRQDFEDLYRTWVEVLLTNLNSEDAQQHIKIVAAGEREAVETFLRSRTLPDPLTETFMNGAENTLQGLEVVNIDGSEFLLALTQAGVPCTPDELEKRIREFLQNQLQGKDRRKTRININW
jgi:hypothetical protein